MNQENKNQTDNPLLVDTGFPPFDRVKPEHVVPAIRQVLNRANERIDGLEQNLVPTWAGLLQPLEQLEHIGLFYGTGESALCSRSSLAIRRNIWKVQKKDTFLL